MGIRETLNKNPNVTTGVTAAVVVLAIGVIIWQLWGGSNGPMGPAGANKQYFSDDDGATYFAESATEIPPFDHNGKQAVRAMVYKCGNGAPFVGVLERYTTEAKTKLENVQKSGKPGDVVMEDVEMTGLEVKKPKTGDKGWVKQNDPRFGAVMRVTCPDGKVDQLRPVTPD